MSKTAKKSAVRVAHSATAKNPTDVTAKRTKRANAKLKAPVHPRTPRRSRQLYESLYAHAPFGLWLVDLSGRTLDMNPTMLALLRCKPEDFSEDISIGDRIAARSRNRLSRIFEEAAELKSGDPDPEWAFETRLLGPRGSTAKVVALSCAPLRNAGGKANALLFTALDISQEQDHEREIRHLSVMDPVTGLANRALYCDRLEQACNSAERNDNHIGVILIDLDNFRDVNETLGFGQADEALRILAERLTANLRKSDSVARLGDDEFAVILTNLKDDSALPELCQSVLDMVTKPIPLSDVKIHLSASIGLASYPADGKTPEQLLKNAAAALSHAKHRGPCSFQLFDNAIQEEAQYRRDLERDLRLNIARESFSLFYQPLVNLETGQMTGVEALLRWPERAESFVSPHEFIPIAEKTGLIVPLGEWVLNQACRQAKAWEDQGLPPLTIAVNVSPVQFLKTDLVESVTRILTETGLSAGWLELELTEHSLLEDSERVLQPLRELRRLGVGLSLDDFGTGFSSLSYLKQFPFSKLKIDRSFVHDVIEDSEAAAIAEAIIDLGHNLDLKVIAEGIENIQQLSFLRAKNCTEGQGYLFSQPIAAEDIVPWANRNRGKRLSIVS